MSFWQSLFGTEVGNGGELTDQLGKLPSLIGRWIGQGVNAYTEASTEFEREWNSYANQMEMQKESGINPFEAFSQLSGNQVQTGSVNPMSEFGNMISNLIALGQGLADLRSKRLSNDSAQIDLLRKRFENRFFFGDLDPGEFSERELKKLGLKTSIDPSDSEVTFDSKGNPIMTVRGKRKSIPEINYSILSTNRNRNDWQGVEDKFNAAKFSFGLEQGFPYDEAEFEHDRKKFDSMNIEYNAKRNQLLYLWEEFLRDELGIDPRSSPWLTSFLGVLKNQSENDSPVGRLLFGLLKFLKGEY